VGLTHDHSSNEALATVSEMRAAIKDLQRSHSMLENWSILVGGPSASFLDITELVDRDFLWLIIPTVLVGIYLVLLFLLGSIFTPLRLILTILMSIIITLGVLVITVQIGLNLPIYWVVPTLLFSTLMGLGMDYDIFLVSRIREEVERGKTDEEAIVEAVERTGLVITACGAIMSAALGTLIISSLLVLQEVGFTLAFAIALDAFIVRIFLVPSIMMLMKKWNWWAPKRIQRVKR
jgi:RND superfamily putative drug exporter